MRHPLLIGLSLGAIAGSTLAPLVGAPLAVILYRRNLDRHTPSVENPLHHPSDAA